MIMKTTSVTNLKSLISILALVCAAIISLTWAERTEAHPPRQEGQQPQFTGAVQSSADGSATLQTQESRLDGAYFSANGQPEGLEVTASGLALLAEATEGSYTSGVIRSPLGFTTDIVPLWGADLPEGTALRLETRLSVDGGNNWSDWIENPEMFYPVRDDLHSGNLIWVGSEGTALQFRLTLRRDWPDLVPVIRSVTLVFSDTSQGPTDGQIAGQMAEVSATVGQVCPVSKPAVVSRTQWGCPEGQNSPRRPPVYAPVTHIIIHQTETPNRPGPYTDYAGWVRSVWNFHTNILWWGDVGYNYLIDPNGTIYEGRAGGDDVVGIHDTHNRGSMAVGFIGCYGNCDARRLTVAEPTQKMLDSAMELMAWKVSQRGLNPGGLTPYDGLPNIPTIAGGRDVVMTTSPGDNLYNKLPQLRERVAQRVNCPQACQITGVVFGKENYKVGEVIQFTVRLADNHGTPLPGAVMTATKSITQAANAQASTGFGFVDRAGEYEGQDTDTQLPGLYTYTFTAADPAGQKFKPCTANASVNVVGAVPPTVTVTITPTSTPTPTVTTTPTVTSTPTVTPTPTITATPTSTPTPTPTTPAGPTVRVNPANLVIPVCSARGTAAVEVVNVSNIIAAQLELRYNPNVAAVIDADPGRDGVQIKVSSAFSSGFVALNKVDPATGLISFAATLLGSSPISGTANLITVDWDPLTVGNANLTLGNVILVNSAGQVVTFTAQNGQLQVTNCTGISGRLALQGRSNYTGITVTSSSGEQTTTGADGAFSIASGDQLTCSFPGYLSAQVDVQAQLAQSGTAAGQPIALGALTLLAGDINADNRIDILDLAYIAKFYNSADSLADLNGDSKVNVMDLVLTASNYGRRGPLTN
jgi:hypothetical protein